MKKMSASDVDAKTSVFRRKHCLTTENAIDNNHSENQFAPLSIHTFFLSFAQFIQNLKSDNNECI